MWQKIVLPCPQTFTAYAHSVVVTTQKKAFVARPDWAELAKKVL